MKRTLLAGLLMAACSCSAWAEDVVLRFSWWGTASRHDVLQKAIKVFEEKNPGVKIKGEFGAFSGYQDKLDKQITSNTEPDIMQINWAWLSVYSRQGEGFYDMYKQRQYLRLNDFPNESYKSGQVWGKLNGLPTSFAARVFLWQQTTFDKAGIPLPKTWSDLFEAGRVFEKKLGKDYYPVDGTVYDVALMAHAYIHQKTGKPYIYPNQAKVALTPEEVLDWVAFFKKLNSEHVVAPLSARAGVGSDAPSEQQPNWMSGKWAGNYTWDSTVKTRISPLPKNARPEVGDFPMLASAKNSGIFGRVGSMLVVGKNTQHPDLAVKFVSFLLSDPEATKVVGTELGMPMSKLQNEYLVKNNMISALDQKAFNQYKSSKVDNPSPNFESPRIQKLLREVFEAVYYGRISDAEAVERLIRDGNTILRKI